LAGRRWQPRFGAWSQLHDIAVRSLRDIDPDTVRLARDIMREPVLAFVVGVLAGTIDATPTARRLCLAALADFERDHHPAVPALKLAIDAARLDGVLS
jgi:hypothetical protein